jgi:hypothetical protein
VSLLSGLSNGLSLLNALSAWPDELINSLVSGVRDWRHQVVLRER